VPFAALMVLSASDFGSKGYAEVAATLVGNLIDWTHCSIVVQTNITYDR
jgi:hypothetical protein